MTTEPSPVVKLPTSIGELELHWDNCLIRTFDSEQFDHLEYFTEEKKTLGLRIGREIMDILFEHDFSYRFDKYPDEATVEWFVKAEMSVMENEIEELE